MEQKKFIYEISLRAGEYQSMKLGGEWEVDHTPTTDEIVALDRELRALAEQVMADRKKPSQKASDKPEVKDTRKLIRNGDKKLQAILNKIQSGTPEETVRKYFVFDDVAENIVRFAFSELVVKNGTPVKDVHMIGDQSTGKTNEDLINEAKEKKTEKKEEH